MGRDAELRIASPGRRSLAHCGIHSRIAVESDESRRKPDRKGGSISTMIRGYTPPADIGRVRNLALGVGVVLTLLLLVGGILDRDHFFHGYLVGFTFWTGVTVGSLMLLMLQHLTGGAWGLVIRRVLEASTRTLPLMLLLFIPIIFGLKQIYPWTNSAFMRETPALQQKAQYLHPSFFIMRSAIYFAFWSLLALTLNWLSLEQD